MKASDQEPLTQSAGTSPRDGGPSIPLALRRRRPRLSVTTRVAVAVAYVTSLLMAALDTHVVNVMLPTLTAEFGTTLSATQWTVLAYILALATAMPASAWLSARFGERRVFLFSLGLFTVSSAGCGLVMGLPELIGMRLIQGAAGGLVMPVATSMLYRTYPPEERAKLTRMLLLPIAVGPALAPPLGGFLVEQLSWRWAFFVNVPVGLVAMGLVWIGLPKDIKERASRFDLVGFLLAGVGLSGVLFVLGQGTTYGWTSAIVIVCSVIGVGALVMFVMVELRTDEPLLDLRLLGSRLFRQTNIASAFQGATFLGGLLYITPIFLQDSEGSSPLQAGLVMSLVPLGVVISAQTVGRRYGVIGPRRMSMIGQILLATVLVAMAFLGGGTSIWVFCLLMFLSGLSNGASMVALQASMFARVSMADTGAASTIFNVNRQLATAFGVAAATVILTSLDGVGSAGLDYRVAYLVAAAFSLLAALGAAFIDDADAAETMVHPSASLRPLDPA